MLPATRLFYVQDERYVTDAWMRKSDDVQDERYVTDAWMRRSDDVQDERAVFMLLDNCSCIALICYIHVTMQKRHFRHPWRSYVTGAWILKGDDVQNLRTFSWFCTDNSFFRLNCCFYFIG